MVACYVHVAHELHEIMIMHWWLRKMQPLEERFVWRKIKLESNSLLSSVGCYNKRESTSFFPSCARYIQCSLQPPSEHLPLSKQNLLNWVSYKQLFPGHNVLDLGERNRCLRAMHSRIKYDTVLNTIQRCTYHTNFRCLEAVHSGMKCDTVFCTSHRCTYHTNFHATFAIFLHMVTCILHRTRDWEYLFIIFPQN